MRHHNNKIFVVSCGNSGPLRLVFFMLLLVLMLSVVANGNSEQSWLISYLVPDSDLPLLSIVDVKKGVLIGPFIIRTSMTGDIALTSPTGSVQTLSVRLGENGFSGDLNLSETGNYAIEESYNLTVELFFNSIPVRSNVFSETHSYTYNNAVTGIKTFNVTSNLSNMGADIDGFLEIYSIEPFSVNPGKDISIMLRALDNVQRDYVLANSITIHGQWDKSSSVTTSNFPPTISINAQPQSSPNSDIRISFTLQDVENALCVIQAEYRGGSASSWTPATLSGAQKSSGSGNLYWRSRMDQPNGQGLYNIRMRASDTLAYSSWVADTVTLNNTTADNNNPPSAGNLRIIVIDGTTNEEVLRAPITGDKLKASYDFFDPDGNSENSSRLQWFKWGILQKSELVSNDQARILTDPITKGETWYFEITPSDGALSGDTRRSATTTIGNAPPSAANLRIEPFAPGPLEDLEAMYTYQDPEGDAEGNSEFLWYKDEVLQPQYISKILPASATDKGEKWKFAVKPRDVDGALAENYVVSSSITIVNQRPEVQITSVSGSKDENGFFYGDVFITYNLIDEDLDACDLNIYYRGGTAGVQKIAAHTKEGTQDYHTITVVEPAIGLTLTWESTKDQPSGRATDYRIGIVPDDGMDTGSDALSNAFSVDNNNAPMATDLAISPSTPFSSDTLVADYTFSDADGDAEIGSVIRWYKLNAVGNPIEQTTYKDLKEVPSEATNRGDDWRFSIEPRDGKESGEIKTSATATIQNAPPEATEVALSPMDAGSDDNLIASYIYNDSDGDDESGTSIKWYRNGIEQKGLADLTLVGWENTDRDDEWYFKIQVSDGVTPGELVESNHIVLGNVAPEVRTLTVPSEGFRDVEIKFDLFDSDGDLCSLVVEYRGGLASTWTPATIQESLINVPANELITLTWESATDEIITKPINFQIRITPNDGTVDGDTVVSDFFTLDNNEPPVVSNLRILPLDPTAVDNLEATYDFFDPDGGQEGGSEIIWYRDDVQTDNKGRTLLASATSKYQAWHYTIRPRDGAKYGEMETSLPVVIGNIAPSVRDVSITPAQPGAGDTLTVWYDYRDLDADRESESFIKWYRNGELAYEITVSSDEDRNMPLPVSKGDQWYAVVTPNDGTDFGEPVSSTAVVAGNAAPIVEGITVTGGAGEAVITYNLIDADDDSCDLSVEYQGGSVVGAAWAAATIAESTSNVAPGTGLKLTWISDVDEQGQKSDDYRIRITPDDGVVTGTSGLSPTFSFSNNFAPTASGLLILPEIATTVDDLEADYVFVDVDGDPEGKPEVQWYKNGFHEMKHNNLTVLPASATARGDRWHYTLRVNDGKEYSKVLQSAPMVIENAAPEATNVILAPEQPAMDAQLVAHYNYEDADGDAEAGTVIQWYRNGVKADFDDFSVIPGVFTQGGDEWYFTVMPNDGRKYGLPQASNRVFVANEPPRVSGLELLPRQPFTTNDLQASYIYDDPENDPEDGSKIIWYKSDVKQSMYNDVLVLPSSATAKKQVWYFTVQPKDGKQFGTVQKSNYIVIGNTAPKVENLVISPPYPSDDDDLMASYDFVDVDGDAEGRSEISWYRNDVWMSSYTSRQLPAKATSDGGIWHFAVKPKDDEDFGEKRISSPVEIGSPMPRVNNLSVVPSIPLTTDSLVASYVYVDPRGISESGSQIKWFKNGVVQSQYKEKILPPEATAKGEQWYFSVTPSNGILLGEEQSAIPVTVINSPPTLIEVMPLPGEPTTDDVIAVRYIFEDVDTDAEIGNEIKWFRDGVLQPAYNNMTEISPSATKRNEEWYFTIRSRDDTDFSELATSSTVIIGNGRPGLANVEILPSEPFTDDDLKVVYTYEDTEDDQESGTEIRWYKNDVHQSEHDDLDTIPSDATAKDEEWYCTVTPSDGQDFGELYTAPIVTVVNTPPVVMEILASSDEVLLRGDSVDIISYGQDADLVDSGVALVCQTMVRFGAGAWEELTTEYVEAPSQRWVATFMPDAQAELGQYDFRARFIDGAGVSSDWIERENLVTVDNRPPVIDLSADNLHVPEDTVEDFDLRELGNDLEDGKTLTWALDESTIEKTLFEAVISGNRFLEIQPVDNKNGQDDITLIVTDTNGAEVSKTDVTIIVDAVNDPPSVPTSVSITPTNPKTSDNLTCKAEGSTDPDEDATIVYRYQWYKDDVLQPALKSGNVPYSRTAKGELWRCEVTPSDGLADGLSRSVEVNIANTLPEASIRKTAGDTKDIIITYDLADADSDDCDLKVEYRIKGKTWKTASIVESLRSVKTGTSLTLIWRSHLDVENVVTDDCRIKITPSDGALPGNPGESAGFPLDNLSPGIAITVIANPIYPNYVDVTVIANEELSEAPDVSIALGEDGEPASLDIREITDTSWTGMLILAMGFDGIVKVTVEGVDLVGNVGEAELEDEFSIPAAVPRPSEFMLGQNYPNPVSEYTNIPYQIPESSDVVIRIYSLTGQLVRTLDEGYRVAGFYLTDDKAARWDGRSDYGIMAASGVYFYYLKAGEFTDVKKMSVSR